MNQSLRRVNIIQQRLRTVLTLMCLCTGTAPVAQTALTGGYSGEFVGRVDGDADRGPRYFGLAYAAIEHHTAPAFGGLTWRGSAWWLHGENFSNVLGDLNGVSNNAGIAAARLDELSVELARERWRLRAGRFNPDTDFMAFDSSSTLINSAFGTPAIATANMPLSTYPLSALGALAEFKPAAGLVVTTAIFDGDVGAESNDLIGFELGSSNIDGVLLIGQISLTTGGPLRTTRWLAGAALHTGDFTDLATDAPRRHNGFLYVGAEQVLGTWQGRRFSANGRVSTPLARRRNPVILQIDSGLAIDGLVSAREDRLALGIVYTGSTSLAIAGLIPPADEVVVELNYRLQVWRSWFIQPALQYVNNEDLTSGHAALLGLFRFGVEF